MKYFETVRVYIQFNYRICKRICYLKRNSFLPFTKLVPLEEKLHCFSYLLTQWDSFLSACLVVVVDNVFICSLIIKTLCIYYIIRIFAFFKLLIFAKILYLINYLYYLTSSVFTQEPPNIISYLLFYIFITKSIGLFVKVILFLFAYCGLL